MLEVKAENIPLDIVYQDEYMAVINKPQGMVVHQASSYKKNDTLVNALLYNLDSLSGINGVIRPGIVHRLDKDTSGLIVVAKNDEAHKSLASQIEKKDRAPNILRALRRQLQGRRRHCRQAYRKKQKRPQENGD